jgi:hypothetical protein
VEIFAGICLGMVRGLNCQIDHTDGADQCQKRDTHIPPSCPVLRGLDAGYVLRMALAGQFLGGFLAAYETIPVLSHLHVKCPRFSYPAVMANHFGFKDAHTRMQIARAALQVLHLAFDAIRVCHVIPRPLIPPTRFHGAITASGGY